MEAGMGPCDDACGDSEDCVAIYGHRWNGDDECFEEALAACDVPSWEPDVVPPLVAPNGGCWSANWKGNPGWDKADEGSPCHELPNTYCDDDVGDDAVVQCLDDSVCPWDFTCVFGQCVSPSAEPERCGDGREGAPCIPAWGDDVVRPSMKCNAGLICVAGSDTVYGCASAQCSAVDGLGCGSDADCTDGDDDFVCGEDSMCMPSREK